MLARYPRSDFRLPQQNEDYRYQARKWRNFVTTFSSCSFASRKIYWGRSNPRYVSTTKANSWDKVRISVANISYYSTRLEKLPFILAKDIACNFSHACEDTSYVHSNNRVDYDFVSCMWWWWMLRTCTTAWRKWKFIYRGVPPITFGMARICWTLNWYVHEICMKLAIFCKIRSALFRFSNLMSKQPEPPIDRHAMLVLCWLDRCRTSGSEPCKMRQCTKVRRGRRWTTCTPNTAEAKERKGRNGARRQ